MHFAWWGYQEYLQLEGTWQQIGFNNGLNVFLTTGVHILAYNSGLGYTTLVNGTKVNRCKQKLQMFLQGLYNGLAHMLLLEPEVITWICLS